MEKQALVVIDLQNDITKNYREIIDGVNAAIAWARAQQMPVVYIRHENITPATRTFKPGTRGAELVPELSRASELVFVKTKSNALTSPEFADWITAEGVTHFYVCGADATACVKSACYNMRKSGWAVTVLSDCVTSYDKKKLPEMFAYYEKQGCTLTTAAELCGSGL